MGVTCLLLLQPEGLHTANTATAVVGDAFQLLVEVMWNALELLRQHTVAQEQVRGWGGRTPAGVPLPLGGRG